MAGDKGGAKADDDFARKFLATPEELDALDDPPGLLPGEEEVEIVPPPAYFNDADGAGLERRLREARRRDGERN
jgi:hypothetical protein